MSTPNPIDLKSGHPNSSHLPALSISRALSSLASSLSSSSSSSACLNYGDEQGDVPFREELATFISAECAGDSLPGGVPSRPADPGDLFVTSGVSHSLDLLASVLLSPSVVGALERPRERPLRERPLVLLESPTYFLAAEIFRSRGAVCKAAPMAPMVAVPLVAVPPPPPSSSTSTSSPPSPSYSGGIDVPSLDRLLSSSHYSPHSPHSPTILYIVPSSQNPTGYTYPLSQRVALCALADKHKLFILADEVYHHLSWSPSVPSRMSALSPSPFVVSVNSFTKVYSPGLRCGLDRVPVSLPPLLPLLPRLHKVAGRPSPPSSPSSCGSLWRPGEVTANIRALVESYERRCTAVRAALQPLSPVVTVPYVPTGGYFVWLTFSFPSPSHSTGEFCDFLEALPPRQVPQAPPGRGRAKPTTSEARTTQSGERGALGSALRAGRRRS